MLNVGLLFFSTKKMVTELKLKFKEPTVGTDWCGKDWTTRPEVWVSCRVSPCPGLCANGAALPSPTRRHPLLTRQQKEGRKGAPSYTSSPGHTRSASVSKLRHGLRPGRSHRTTTTTTLEVLSWSFVGTCRVAKLSESPSVRAPGRGRTRRRAAASPQLHPPRCPSQVLSVTILALVLSPVASRF